MPSDHGGDVLAVMSVVHSGQHPLLLAEQGPRLVAGVVTMDDSSFTTKIQIHSGLVAAQLGCVALLDTGSPQTFITTHALETMKRAGASSAICERHTPPRCWWAFGKSTPLQTSTAMRLSVQFFHDHPTTSLAVWAYVVSAEAMEYDVLLGRDNWMRFNDRSYRMLAPRSGNTRVLGKRTLSLRGLHDATAFVLDSSTHPESFHLLYAGDADITLSRDYRLVDVDFFAGMMPRPLPAAISSTCCTRLIISPLAGVADLEPGALLGISSSPLLRAPLEAIMFDTPAPTLLPCDARERHFSVPGPVTAPSMDADQLLPLSQCLDPFIHHLCDATVLPCHESEAPVAQSTYRSPSPSLLERLSAI